MTQSDNTSLPGIAMAHSFTVPTYLGAPIGMAIRSDGNQALVRVAVAKRRHAILDRSAAQAV